VGARERFVRLILIADVTLGSLVDLTGISTPARGAIIAVMLVGVVAAFPGGEPRITGPRSLALWAFVTVTAISYLRFALDPIAPVTARSLYGLFAMLILSAIFAYCALLAPATRSLQRQRLRCALYAPVVFVEVNLILWIVGFSLPTDITQSSGGPNTSEMLSLIGLHVTRVNFPLSPGINGAGSIAAVALVICSRLLLGRQRDERRRPIVVGIAASIATIALADSRGALVFGIVALGLSSVSLRRWATAMPLALPLAPAIILFAVGRLGSLTPSLSRQQGDFVTATGRETIWDNVVRFLGHPHVQDLVGYGAYGQTRTGIGWMDAYLFPGVQYPQFNSVHSLALQTILDTGWIGLAVLIWFLVVAFSSAYRTASGQRSLESGALLGALMALMLIGSDEALPGIGGFYLVIALVTLGTAGMRVVAPARALVRQQRSRNLAANGASPTAITAIKRPMRSA
jgi:hypothetical protein